MLHSLVVRNSDFQCKYLNNSRLNPSILETVKSREQVEVVLNKVYINKLKTNNTKKKNKYFMEPRWMFLTLKYWKSPFYLEPVPINAKLEAWGSIKLYCYFTGWALWVVYPGTSGLQCGGPQQDSKHPLPTPSVLVIIRVGPMLPPHQSVVSNASITQVSQVVYSVVDTTRLQASSANSFCPSDHKGWPNATATPVCGKE